MFVTICVMNLVVENGIKNIQDNIKQMCKIEFDNYLITKVSKAF